MRHVVILIETSRAYGRGLLRGVARYNRERGNWFTYFEPQGLGDPPSTWLRSWKGDGILARINNRETAQAVRKLGVPVVNLRGTMPGLPFPFIGSDNEAIAKLCADHLLERGFRHFGVCGYRASHHPGMALRCETFQQLVTSAGFECSVFSPTFRGNRPPLQKEQEDIARWIKQLTKPVGIMAVNDDRGMEVLEACRICKAAVPDEVAVIGVDNDEFLCSLSIPPLSSVDVNSEETGYQAAALLDRMMAGHASPKQLPQTKPRQVITRRSTDVLATNYQEVVQAVCFIREHACDRIEVANVLHHVGGSRASLEPRMKEVLGRTIHQEIRRVQLERAKQLLLESDLPIKQIAVTTGFKSAQYLTRVFHAATSQTPAAWRRQHRTGN